MFIMLRGFCAGWSPRSLQDVRLGDAERVIVLSERTPSFLKGHMNLAVIGLLRAARNALHDARMYGNTLYYVHVIDTVKDTGL